MRASEMKVFQGRSMIAVAVVAMCCSPLARLAAAPLAPDQVAVRINGKPILAADVYRLASEIAKNAQVSVEAAWSDALEQAMTTELLVQAAVAAGIRVTNKEVETELQQARAAGPGHPMNEWLSQTDPVLARKELQRSLLIEKFLDQRIKVRITPAQVEEYYREHGERFDRPPMVRASHILIRIQGNDREAARRKAEEILARAREGEDFGELAKQYSQDAYTARKGGDLDFFPERPTPVAQAAFQLELGQISDVVESPYGFHIIKVTDRRPAGRAPLHEVADEIRSMLEDDQREEAEEALIEDLRAKAKVEVLLPKLANDGPQSR
ncbi:MAG: peptidylprolyl isomerase [Candidatus Binatia bacterium]|nr:peptidylprolyl isomerase [Candidatus Binatia bacterium]